MARPPHRLRRRHLYQPHPGPPRFPPNDGKLLRGQGTHCSRQFRPVRNKKPTAVINIDDPTGRRLVARLDARVKIIRYGLGAGADFRASNVRFDVNGTHYQLEVGLRKLLVRLPLIGRFNVYNSLAALAAAAACGLNLREAVATLAAAPQVPGRSKMSAMPAVPRFSSITRTLPTRWKMPCRTLRELDPRRLITVFGCGGDRDRASARGWAPPPTASATTHHHLRQPAHAKTLPPSSAKSEGGFARQQLPQPSRTAPRPSHVPSATRLTATSSSSPARVMRIIRFSPIAPSTSTTAGAPSKVHRANRPAPGLPLAADEIPHPPTAGRPSAGATRRGTGCDVSIRCLDRHPKRFGEGRSSWRCCGENFDGHDFRHRGVRTRGRGRRWSRSWKADLPPDAAVIVVDGHAAGAAAPGAPAIAKRSAVRRHRHHRFATARPSTKDFAGRGHVRNVSRECHQGQPEQPHRRASDRARGRSGAHRRGLGNGDEPFRRDRPAVRDRPARTSAIITNIGTAHIEFLGSREGIAARRACSPRPSPRADASSSTPMTT